MIAFIRRQLRRYRAYLVAARVADRKEAAEHPEYGMFGDGK